MLHEFHSFTVTLKNSILWHNVYCILMTYSLTHTSPYAFYTTYCITLLYVLFVLITVIAFFTVMYNKILAKIAFLSTIFE